MVHGFEVTVCERQPGEVRFIIRGELDLAEAPRLLELMLDAAEVYDHHILLLDMSAVTFVDSTCLGVLIDVHKRLCNRGSHLVIMNPAPITAKLIRMTALDSFLDVRSDTEALRSLAQAN